ARRALYGSEPQAARAACSRAEFCRDPGHGAYEDRSQHNHCLCPASM
ncbi:MAG: hypothetical protein AVDCRST_MAG93-8625, partial [uncultured Chloroflexia bacterium]